MSALLSSSALTLPLFIDSSMLVCFRQCPKKFEYEYINCLRPKGRKVDLVAGGAFAAALEAAYVARFADNKTSDEALVESYRAFARSWGDFEDEPESGKSFSRTFQAVLDYFATYPFDTDHVRPLMRHDGRPTFEFSFAIPLTDEKFPRHPTGVPFLYSGRFDAFGQMDHDLVIRDEKTMGKTPTKWWANQWDLRNQFLGYTWAARRSGFNVSKVVVRGVAILKTLFHQVEAIKIYPDFLLARFEDQLARDLHRLVDCYDSEYFDFDLGDACMAFGRPCSFSDCCSAADPTVWFPTFDRERWDPTNRTSTPLTLEDAA